MGEKGQLHLEAASLSCSSPWQGVLASAGGGLQTQSTGRLKPCLAKGGSCSRHSLGNRTAREAVRGERRHLTPHQERDLSGETGSTCGSLSWRRWLRGDLDKPGQFSRSSEMAETSPLDYRLNSGQRR